MNLKFDITWGQVAVPLYSSHTAWTIIVELFSANSTLLHVLEKDITWKMHLQVSTDTNN